MQLYQLDCTFPDTLTEKAQEILSQIYPEGWEEMSSQDQTTFRLLSQEKDVLENGAHERVHHIYQNTGENEA